jgi:hypothetical protein
MADGMDQSQGPQPLPVLGVNSPGPLAGVDAPLPAAAVTPNPSAAAAPAGGSAISQQVAQGTQVANKLNPGNWAQNMIAGALTALSGFDVGKVEPGQGWLTGAGRAAKQMQQQKQQQTENQREQQKLDMAQQNQDRDYQLKLQENARQQAASIREQSDHDMRMKAFTQEGNLRDFNMMKAEADFRQSQLDKEDALKRVGAKPMMVAGQESPAFDDLGQAEKFAQDNALHNAHENDYRTRIVLGADNKYHLMEVPDDGVKEYTLKDPSGKDVKVWTDPLGALNYAEKVAQVKHTSAEANEQEAKAAQERILAGNGSISDKAMVAGKVFTDMMADPGYKSLPRDDSGRIDETSPEYQALDNKYGVTKAYKDASLGYNNLHGEAYVRLLSPNLQSQVRALGEGREDSSLLPRGKEKTPIVNALNQAYPGFDEGEQKNYFKSREAFTTGKQGQQVNQGMVAFNHLANLMKLSNAWDGALVPGTPPYQAYQNQLDTVVGELGQFYGTSTVSGIEDLKKTLDATNPQNRNKAIQTQAHSMNEKMEEFSQQWDDSIPKYLKATGQKVPMPGVNAESLRNRDTLLGVKPPAPPRPAGAVGTVPGSDGHQYYHNAQNQILGRAD